MLLSIAMLYAIALAALWTAYEQFTHVVTTFHELAGWLCIMGATIAFSSAVLATGIQMIIARLPKPPTKPPAAWDEHDARYRVF